MSLRKEYRDELNRKIKVDYKKSDGSLDYSNEYFYNGDNQTPSQGVQTFFHPNGQISLKKDAVYSAEKNGMVFIKECSFDETGEITQEISFDEKSGLKTKQKIFKRNDEGFLFAHRTTFKADGKTPETDGIFISLAGKLCSVDDKNLQKLVKKMNNPFDTNAKNTAKEQTLSKESRPEDIETKRTETIYDELKRPVKVIHSEVNSIFEYSYRGKEKKPRKVVQIKLNNGIVESKQESIYSAQKSDMVLNKESFYDSEGKIKQELLYNEESGLLAEKRDFKKNEQGLFFSRCTAFDADGKTPKSIDYRVRLAGNDYSLNDIPADTRGKNPFETKGTSASKDVSGATR